MNDEMQKIDLNDLEWSAMCYLTGEFDEVECRRFEQLLAERSEVRTALEQALEVMQCTVAAHDEQRASAVRLTPEQPAASSGKIFGKLNGAAMALAATAILAATIAIGFALAAQGNQSQGESVSTALSWSYNLPVDESDPEPSVATEGFDADLGDSDLVDAGWTDTEFFETEFGGLEANDFSERDDSDWLSVAVS